MEWKGSLSRKKFLTWKSISNRAEAIFLRKSKASLWIRSNEVFDQGQWWLARWLYCLGRLHSNCSLYWNLNLFRFLAHPAFLLQYCNRAHCFLCEKCRLLWWVFRFCLVDMRLDSIWILLATFISINSAAASHINFTLSMSRLFATFQLKVRFA